MRPQDALSPRDRIEPGSLNVVYTAPNGDWSLAEMVWDGEPAIGCRWNGDINDPEDKGNPRSHSQGTWFILPDELGFPLVGFAKTFRSSYRETISAAESEASTTQMRAEQIGRFLEGEAKKKRTVYYANIATRFNLPRMDGAWRSHALSHIFDLLDREDAEKKRPFRTALVISQANNMPGDGFFEALQVHKGILDVKSERDAVFTRELNAAFAYPY